jgi:competence protein ComEC
MKFIHIPFLFLYAVAWITHIINFIFIKYKISFWLLFILAVLLGGLFLLNSYILPYPHIRNFTFYKSEQVTITGTVTSFPQNKPNFSSFVLTADQLIWAGKIYPVCGKVMIKLFRKQKVCYADRLILRGKLFRPYQTKNNHFSYRYYLENHGIYSILTVNKNTPIKYSGKGRVNPFKFIAYKIRKKGNEIFPKYLKATQAGILSAMILGQRSKVTSRLRRLFIQTGTMHILAISGLHVGIVAYVLELLLKVLRLKRNIRYLVIILLLILYCLLTGLRPSAVRATIMAIVVLSGFLLIRNVGISHSLSLAALIILIVNPRQLFNIGFQLSFISVFSIVYLAPIIRNLINFNNLKNKYLKFCTSGFSVSLAAWLGVLPLVAYYFKIISPITVLVNLIIVPYLTIVITLGFSLLCVGILFPILAPIFAAPANLSIIILIQIIKFFNQIPCAYFYL